MRRIVLAAGVLAAVLGFVAYRIFPAEFMHYTELALMAGLRLWHDVEANPAPVCLAVATFLLTVIYHKARGKCLRESV